MRTIGEGRAGQPETAREDEDVVVHRRQQRAQQGGHCRRQQGPVVSVQSQHCSSNEPHPWMASGFILLPTRRATLMLPFPEHQ